MIVMIHSNRARLENGSFQVDRKFHTGMQEYVARLGMPLLTVHPEAAPGQEAQIMDLIAVPEAELGYRAMTLKCSAPNRPLPSELVRLGSEIARCRLVYAGTFASAAVTALCAEHRVPYAAVVEYNLKTTVVFATAGVKGLVARVPRGARAANFYVREVIPFIWRAAIVHCNGYPIYEESRRLNRQRLLYLDSRMRGSMLIDDAALERRLADRRGRIPRLIFSGRFEAAKGALDVVKVASEQVLRDIPFELVIYGQGSQREAMERLVAERGLSPKVKIHEAVPFPRLVELSRECDLFVCCHVQDDPSCTYLEAMGCGLPVAGYANAMWRSMQAQSQAGVVTKLGAPDALAEALRALLTEPTRLDDLSRRARSFAVAHTFEREFNARIESIETLVPANAKYPAIAEHRRERGTPDYAK
jgi:colanic acid/amylovoran biosynthesis glycosyltransferase